MRCKDTTFFASMQINFHFAAKMGVFFEKIDDVEREYLTEVKAMEEYCSARNRRGLDSQREESRES